MTTDFVARSQYRLAKARHRLRKARLHGAPVVVFAMAKTGTTGVAAGLRDAGIAPVFQVHDLDPAFLDEEERQYHWSGRPWRIWDARSALARPPTPEGPWRVVCLVRDPIAQSVSAFFQPGVRHGYLTDTADVGPLLRRFGDRLDRLPLGWFESHLEPTLGIDVYASPFDPEKGYGIIKSPSVELLLLRCEGLAVAPSALAELLHREQPIAVPRRNVGSDKDYGRAYDAFVSALRPSPETLDRTYSSRIVTHFYTPDEIAQFREFWSVRTPLSGP
jgi:hypothetical protein